MQITPIEIRQKRFEKKIRGYHTDEVDAFLHSLAHSWEKLLTELSEVKKMLVSYQKDIERLENLEDALLKTIRDGEKTAGHMIEQAQKEKELIVKEASIEANRLIQEAKLQAQQIETTGKNEANALKKDMEQALATTQTALQETHRYKKHIIKQLQVLGEEVIAKSQTLQTNLSELENE